MRPRRRTALTPCSARRDFELAAAASPAAATSSPAATAALPAGARPLRGVFPRLHVRLDQHADRVRPRRNILVGGTNGAALFVVVVPFVARHRDAGDRLVVVFVIGVLVAFLRRSCSAVT